MQKRSTVAEANVTQLSQARNMSQKKLFWINSEALLLPGRNLCFGNMFSSLNVVSAALFPNLASRP